jgi:hypothetical protein
MIYQFNVADGSVIVVGDTATPDALYRDFGHRRRSNSDV